MKRVIIIGAGPAGLFAANELAGKAEVVIYDKGKDEDKRSCPKTKMEKGVCVHCNPCQITHGVGGAGLITDGKLMYDIRIGNNLNEIISVQQNQQLVDRVERIFQGFGVHTSERNEIGIEEIKKAALRNRVEFIYPRQAHVGSDKLPGLIHIFRKDLEKRGVEFRTLTNIASLEEMLVKQSDAVLVAPGRVGGGDDWLENILRAKNIEFSYRPVDIGTRVETDSVVTKHITDITRDMKFYLTPDQYPQARVRTFCTCPNGHVAQEAYNGLVTVNGHAESEAGRQTPNTNFSILVTVPLTKPQSNSNENARKLGEYVYNLGGGKIIAQRYGDFRRHRRSKEEKQAQHFLQATLKDITWGSLYFLPEIYHSGIDEAMQRLDGIMPGLASDSTILYIPEIKFHGLKIPTDDHLRVKSSENLALYAAGDGAGVSRGIVGAAASGILAAEGILQD